MRKFQIRGPGQKKVAGFQRSFAEPRYFMVFSLVLLNLIVNAQIFDNFVPYAANVSLYLSAGVCLYCMMHFDNVGYNWAFVTAASWIVLVLVQKVVFNLSSGQYYDLSGMLEATTFIAFSVFAYSRIHPLKLMKIIFFLTVPYLAFYILVSLSVKNLTYVQTNFLSGYIGQDSLESVRTGRVFLASSFAAFALFYSFVEMRHKFSFYYFGTIILSATAIYLSQSRLFEALVILSLFILFLPRSLSLVTTAGFGIFLIVVVVLCFGVIDRGANPFALFASDASGLARAYEYETAKNIVRESPIFGTGVAANAKPAFQLYIYHRFSDPRALLYFPTDLGAIGVWSYYGLAGLIAFLVGTFFCFYPPRSIDGYGRHSLTLRVVALMNGLYGLTAPVILIGTGQLFFSLLLYACMTGPNWNAKRFVNFRTRMLRPLRRTRADPAFSGRQA